MLNNLYWENIKHHVEHDLRTNVISTCSGNEKKNESLKENSMNSINQEKLNPKKPNPVFVNKDSANQEEYEKGFKVDELFILHIRGVTIHDDENPVSEKAFKGPHLKYSYRPFDTRFINSDLKKIIRHRSAVMKNSFSGENIGILCAHQGDKGKFGFFISKNICDINYTGENEQSGEGAIFPLYNYPEMSEQLDLNKSSIEVAKSAKDTEANNRKPNLNMDIVKKIQKGLGLLFIPEAETGNVCFATNNAEMRDDFKSVFTPLDLLDYIYAVLHSPTYRKKYKEFLKIDSPRIPYPADSDIFWQLAKLGSKLRQIHLLECSDVNNFITQYPTDGDNVITRKMTKDNRGFIPTENGLGKVYINDEQYFDNVPEIAWDFYIGDYQPAQKWLKDRVGHKLEDEEIQHYQKIIVALTETDKLMKEIDRTDFLKTAD